MNIPVSSHNALTRSVTFQPPSWRRPWGQHGQVRALGVRVRSAAGLRSRPSWKTRTRRCRCRCLRPHPSPSVTQWPTCRWHLRRHLGDEASAKGRHPPVDPQSNDAVATHGPTPVAFDTPSTSVMASSASSFASKSAYRPTRWLEIPSTRMRAR